MRRVRHILFGLAALTVGFFACSKDHEMIVSFHEGWLAAPTDLEAKLVDSKEIVLEWNMPDTRNVNRYVLSMSDTGKVIYRKYIQDIGYVENTPGYFDVPDSTRYIFQVWAVDEDLFEGPKSKPDTVLILKQ